MSGSAQIVVHDQVSKYRNAVYQFIGLAFRAVIAEHEAFIGIKLIEKLQSQFGMLAGGGDSSSLGNGGAALDLTVMKLLAFFQDRIRDRNKLEVRIHCNAQAVDIIQHAAVFAGGSAEIAAHHGNTVIKCNSGGKVGVNQAFSIPLSHQSHILSVAFCERTVLYFAVLDKEVAALGYVGHAEIKGCVQCVVLADAGIGQTETTGHAQFILGACEILVPVVEGDRHFHAELVQDILADDQTALGFAFLVHIGHLAEIRHAAAVGDRVDFTIQACMTCFFIVRCILLNKILQINDDAFIDGGVSALAVVVVKPDDDIGIFAGCQHQGEVVGVLADGRDDHFQMNAGLFLKGFEDIQVLNITDNIGDIVGCDAAPDGQGDRFIREMLDFCAVR